MKNEIAKALVTGHTGFIGKNLVPELKRRRTDVITFSSGEGNDVLDLQRILHQTKDVNIVYHLAAYAKPAESIQNPMMAIDVNVRGTFNILEACRKNDLSLVYPSTCEIYGDSTSPIEEGHSLNPPNPYAASKAAADRLCYSYFRAYGLRVVMLRIFNPYGPHQQLNKIIPTFYFEAMAKKPITVYGDGTDTRDYTYVSDVVNAMLKAHKLPSGEAINICTGRAVTNLEVAKMVKKITNSTSPIVNVSYPPVFGGIRNQVGSSSKARSLMSWHSTVVLDDGLNATIKWLQTLPVTT